MKITNSRSQLAKALLFTALFTAASAAAVPSAWASWAKSATGSAAKGKAYSMPTAAGTTPSTAASGADVTVSWAQNNFQGTTKAVPTAKVFRYPSATGGIASTPLAGCNTQVASGCVEKAAPLGTWFYSEQPSVGGWNGVESTSRSAAVSLGSLAIAAGGGATTRQPDKGDSITITFPAGLQASSVCAAWTSTGAQTLTGDGNNPGALVVTFTKGTGTGHDSVSFSSNACGSGNSLNVGTIDLGTTGYVSSTTAVFNSGSGSNATTLTYTPGNQATSASTIVVQLGSNTGTTARNATTATAAATYTPGSLKYASTGNPAVSGTLTSAAGPLF
jgi:hypothetical protein